MKEFISYRIFLHFLKSAMFKTIKNMSIFFVYSISKYVLYIIYLFKTIFFP